MSLRLLNGLVFILYIFYLHFVSQAFLSQMCEGLSGNRNKRSKNGLKMKNVFESRGFENVFVNAKYSDKVKVLEDCVLSLSLQVCQR